MSFFPVFQGGDYGQIAALFSCPNCPVGRGSQRPLLVQLDAKMLLVFKEPLPHSGPSLRRKYATLPFVRFWVNGNLTREFVLFSG
jgi:hypothetical protein